MPHAAAVIQVIVLTKTCVKTENAHLKKALTIALTVLKQSAERECFPKSNRMAFLCLHADTEMNCLERNEKDGVVYHREGITGDYDDFTDAEELVSFILNGRK